MEKRYGKLERQPALQTSTAWPISFLGVIVTCLVACSPPPTGTNDYRTTNPIGAVHKTFSTELGFSDSDELIAINDPRVFIKFIQNFHRTSNGHITLTTREEGRDTQETNRITSVIAYLEEFGIRPSEIDVLINEELPTENTADILLSFLGSVVEVPNCGDWSGEAGYNPTNLPTKNYGCAYQRNIGLMISNPQDLRQASAGSIADSQMLERIIQLYRAGEETSIQGVQHSPALSAQ